MKVRLFQSLGLKNRRGLLGLSCFLFFALSSSDVHAGAWVREPGHYYFETTFGYYEADKVYNFQGRKIPNQLTPDPNNPGSALLIGTYRNTTKQYDFTIYTEIGIFKNLEGILSFPVFKINDQVASVGTYSSSGIGDMIASLKYKLVDRPWGVFATQVDFGIPIANEKAKGSVRGEVDQPNPLGDGEWDVGILGWYSYSFYPFPAYASASLGYRYRSKSGGVDFGNDIPWSVDGGITLTLGEKWFTDLTPFFAFRGVMATKDLNFATQISAGAAATGNVPNQEYIDIAPGFSLTLYKALAWVNTYTYTLDGKNTGAGWSIRSGFSWTH